MSEKQTAKLKNWYLFEQQLYGIVYNHPILTDGEKIITSLVLNIDFKNNKAETRNTNYTLEERCNNE